MKRFFLFGLSLFIFRFACPMQSQPTIFDDFESEASYDLVTTDFEVFEGMFKRMQASKEFRECDLLIAYFEDLLQSVERRYHPLKTPKHSKIARLKSVLPGWISFLTAKKEFLEAVEHRLDEIEEHGFGDSDVVVVQEDEFVFSDYDKAHSDHRWRERKKELVRQVKESWKKDSRGLYVSSLKQVILNICSLYKVYPDLWEHLNKKNGFVSPEIFIETLYVNGFG